MKFKWEYAIIFIVAIVLVASHIMMYQLGKVNAEKTYTTVNLPDIDSSYNVTLKPRIDSIEIKQTKIDTVYLPGIDSITVDTIYIDSKKYVASADTSFRNDSLQVNVKWNSTIPIDAKGYFEINVIEKLKTAVKMVEVDLPFYQKFAFGFIFGILVATGIFLLAVLL